MPFPIHKCVFLNYSYARNKDEEERFPLFSSDETFPYIWYNSKMFQAEIGNSDNNNRRVMIENKIKARNSGNESGLCHNII